MREKIILTINPYVNGIWIDTSDNDSSSGRIASYHELELPEELTVELDKWFEAQQEYRILSEKHVDIDTLNKQGLELAKRLKRHLFYRAMVFYKKGDNVQKIYGYMVMGDMCASVWDDEDNSCALEDIEDDLNGFKIEDCDSLQKRFDLWENEFGKCYSDDIDWDLFNKEGRALVEELQKRLPEYCSVFYNHAYEESHPQWWK